MRNEVDYELSRYDVYKSYTELFLNQGRWQPYRRKKLGQN
jgi:hypothetical protein